MSDHAAVVQQIVCALQQTLVDSLQPSKELFPNVQELSDFAPAAQQERCALFMEGVALALETCHDLLLQLPVPLVYTVSSPIVATQGSAADKQPTGSSILIEEVPESHEEQQSQHQIVAVVEQLLQLLALFKELKQLTAPWATPGLQPCCQRLQDALTCKVQPTEQVSTHLSKTGSLSLLKPEQVLLQDLLAASLPSWLLRIKSVVAGKHMEGEDFMARKGPGVFERMLAARQLAWLVSHIKHPFIGPLVPHLLPVVLAAADDPSAVVSRHGIQALRWLADEALTADLLWQAELLRDVAKRLVVGCEEHLSEVAYPAAVAVVCKLEGRNVRAYGYHMLTSELLTEVERSGHMLPRRMAFLDAFPRLAQCMGLTVLQHLGRLMPLLLEWLQAYDSQSVKGSSDLLEVIIRGTWPRIAVHAPTVWRHTIIAYARETAAAAKHQRDAHEAESQPAHQSYTSDDFSPSDTHQQLPKTKHPKESYYMHSHGAAEALKRVCTLLSQCAGDILRDECLLDQNVTALPSAAQSLQAGLLHA